MLSIHESSEMIFKAFLISMVIAISVSIVSAQDDEPAVWQIEERCLLPAVVREEAFDGEILMTGWGGIHAVSTKLDTPYIVNWGYGQISPDGRWILEQDRKTDVIRFSSGEPMGVFITTYGDIVAKNIDTDETITFSWNAIIEKTSGPYPHGSAGPIWLDNNSFVSFYDYYGMKYKVGHLDTGEISEWQRVGLEDYEYSISPDGTRAVSYAQLYDLSDNSLIREDLVGTNYDLKKSVWTNDATMFADVIVTAVEVADYPDVSVGRLRSYASVRRLIAEQSALSEQVWL